MGHGEEIPIAVDSPFVSNISSSRFAFREVMRKVMTWCFAAASGRALMLLHQPPQQPLPPPLNRLLQPPPPFIGFTDACKGVFLNVVLLLLLLLLMMMMRRRNPANPIR